MLNIAVRAARAAGNVIVRSFEQQDKVEVSSKGLNDFVTNVDKAAEEAIIEIISKAYPKHSIVSEECGVVDGEDNDYQWLTLPSLSYENMFLILGLVSIGLPMSLHSRLRGTLDQHKHHVSPPLGH